MDETFMKCKVFTGAPKNVGNEVNKWFEEQRSNKLGQKIISVTQSHEETHGNMMLTIIYNEYNRHDL